MNYYLVIGITCFWLFLLSLLIGTQLDGMDIFAVGFFAGAVYFILVSMLPKRSEQNG